MIECEGCATPYERSRRYFPWGPRKAKYCVECIDKRFREILEELELDFDKIEEEVNGNV